MNDIELMECKFRELEKEKHLLQKQHAKEIQAFKKRIADLENELKDAVTKCENIKERTCFMMATIKEAIEEF